VPSFVHYLEVLEGTDGDKMPGIGPLPLYLSSYSVKKFHLHLIIFCDVLRSF
jgi:hypothetical protein